MLLAIDIGNTNSVFAVYDGQDTPRAVWRLRTEAGRTHDAYAAFLLPLLATEGLSFSDIGACVVSSVVPEADRYVQRFADTYLSCPLDCVTAEKARLSIALDDHQQLGADRIVNALAVRTEYAMPAVVVDLGTATTFDVIGADGVYLGGAICPGIRLSLETLRMATAKLPKVAPAKTECVIGKSTTEAMQSGMYWGYVGLMNGLLDQIEGELGQSLRSVILTGGLAALFKDDVPRATHVDETLTLKGLYLFHKDCE